MQQKPVHNHAPKTDHEPMFDDEVFAERSDKITPLMWLLSALIFFLFLPFVLIEGIIRAPFHGVAAIIRAWKYGNET